MNMFLLVFLVSMFVDVWTCSCWCSWSSYAPTPSYGSSSSTSSTRRNRTSLRGRGTYQRLSQNWMWVGNILSKNQNDSKIWAYFGATILNLWSRPVEVGQNVGICGKILLQSQFKLYYHFDVSTRALSMCKQTTMSCTYVTSSAFP